MRVALTEPGRMENPPKSRRCLTEKLKIGTAGEIARGGGGLHNVLAELAQDLHGGRKAG